MTTTENNAEPLDDGEWEIYTLDVGQADAHLIISPEGTTTAIDADEEQVADVLANVLSEREGTDETISKTINYFIATHIHRDHVTGLQELKDAGYSIEQTYQPNANRYEIGKDGRVKRSVLLDYFEALSEHGFEPEDIKYLSTGDEIFQEGETSLTALSPPPTDEELSFTRPSTGRKCAYRPEKANPNGVVCQLSGPEISCLFMGDMENDAAHNAESWLVFQHDRGERDQPRYRYSVFRASWFSQRDDRDVSRSKQSRSRDHVEWPDQQTHAER